MTKTISTYKDSLSDIHGNLVISYEEGECLGNVGDIYFDKATCGIKGLSLVPKLLEPDEKDYIKFKDILKLGNSVVIVSKKGALGKLPKTLADSCLRLLRDIRVVTQDGENLGEMADVSVDTATGTVQELHLFGDKTMRLNVEKDKIRIGRDMIVVPVAYKDNITRRPKKTNTTKQVEDRLSSVVKNAGIVTRRFADTIAGSINEAVHKVTGAPKHVPSQAESSKAASKKAQNAAGAPAGPVTKSSPQKKAAKKAAKKAPAKKAPAK